MEMIVWRSTSYTGVFLRSFSRFTTARSSSGLRCLCQCDFRRWNNILYDTRQPKKLSSSFSLPHSLSILNNIPTNVSKEFRGFTSQVKDEKKSDEGILKKFNIFQKMKQLTKDYWYILIPVHIVTSLGWVGIFYLAAQNGVDIIPLLEFVHTPQKYIDIIKNSNAGHWAVCYALYKIFTPLRYTVTVGGTTMTVKYLDKRGYLKFKGRPTEVTSLRQRNPGVPTACPKKKLTRPDTIRTEKSQKKISDKI